MTPQMRTDVTVPIERGAALHVCCGVPVLWVAFLTSACSAGALGNADPSAACAAQDSACTAAAIPPVAVGAALTLTATPLPGAGAEAPATHLRVVNESVAILDQGTIRAVGPGTTAVLFLTDDERVLELTHVAAAEPIGILIAKGQDSTLDARGFDGTLVARSGEDMPLTVIARSDSQRLGGDLEARVHVDDPRVRVRLDAGNGFTLLMPPLVDDDAVLTTLHVDALGFSTSLPLEVMP